MNFREGDGEKPEAELFRSALAENIREKRVDGEEEWRKPGFRYKRKRKGERS